MRAYSRTGSDDVHTQVDVGREDVYLKTSRDGTTLVAHLSRAHALELAENIMYVLKSDPA